MTPDCSSSLTRRRQADSDRPTRAASAALAMAPSPCSSPRIRRSVRSICIICGLTTLYSHFPPDIYRFRARFATPCEGNGSKMAPIRARTGPPPRGSTTMHIGVPSEIKIHEYRVGLMPAAVRELVSDGHQLSVQSGAGNGVGCSDEDYRAAGAQILADAPAVFAASELIVKVKEPQAAQFALLRPRQA